MSTQIGNQAEGAVVEFLISIGHKVIDRNWRTPVCEIDIISMKSNVVHFVEVKYRSTTLQGGGLEYITPKKLKQMKFAADCWVQENKWEGDYVLDAVEVGSNFEINEFIESIE